MGFISVAEQTEAVRIRQANEVLKSLIGQFFNFIQNLRSLQIQIMNG
jgi:hypothetical protein